MLGNCMIPMRCDEPAPSGPMTGVSMLPCMLSPTDAFGHPTLRISRQIIQELEGDTRQAAASEVLSDVHDLRQAFLQGTDFNLRRRAEAKPKKDDRCADWRWVGGFGRQGLVRLRPHDSTLRSAQQPSACGSPSPLVEQAPSIARAPPAPAVQCTVPAACGLDSSRASCRWHARTLSRGPAPCRAATMPGTTPCVAHGCRPPGH